VAGLALRADAADSARARPDRPQPGGLPGIRAAFARGQLSFAKVRALTRVAEPANEENLLELSLTPGEYALICFVPDAKDGKAHFAHGMMSTFVVK